MSNEKLTALVAITVPALTDLLYDVPVGEPIGNRITLGNLLANAPSVVFANSHTFPGVTLTGAVVGAVTQSLLNTVSTTINFGGAATVINVGAATGTITIGNPTIVGPATLALFNTVTTTLNFAGAATVVTIGAAAVALSIGGTDVKLNRDAANVLAQRNGTTAQAFNIYNTFTNSSNYERGILLWSSNTFIISTDNLGTGVLRPITFSGSIINMQIGGTNNWVFNASKHFVAGSDNVVDIGAAGATRPRTVYVATSVITPLVSAGAAGLTIADAASAQLVTFAGTGYGAGVASLRLNGLTTGAGVALGTLTNAPSAGDPAFWIPINIAGTVRYVPAW